MITNDVDEAVLMADRIAPLTMGPGATFADEFTVNMERPRARRTLNDHPEFMRLKTQITLFMMGLNKAAQKDAQAPLISMPDIRPRDFALPSANIRLKNKKDQPTSAA